MLEAKRLKCRIWEVEDEIGDEDEEGNGRDDYKDDDGERSAKRMRLG